MKINARPTAMERMSARKLNNARDLADGLNQVITTIEIPKATIIPIMLEDPEKRLAAEGDIRNWNSTNLLM